MFPRARHSARRASLALLCGAGAALFVACSGGGAAPTSAQQPTAAAPAQPGSGPGPVTILLSAQNNSGQSGTATLTAEGDKTRVLLNLSPGPAGVAQPVHIHTGSCSNLGGVQFPLTNLQNGKSTTVVNAPLDSMRTGGYAINAHKSDAEADIYTSCGNIPGQGAGPTSGQSGGPRY